MSRASAVAVAGGLVILWLIPWSADRSDRRLRIDPESDDTRGHGGALAASAPDPREAPRSRLEDPPEVAEPQRPDVPELQHPVRAGPVELLRATFEGDAAAVDSQRAERSIRDLFGSGPLPLDALQRIECRRRVCRIDLWWSERHPLVYVSLATRVTKQQSPHLAVEPGIDRNLQDELPLEVYVLRAGFDLDELERE